jgi:CRISPR-associated endonuclease/helicase Cas3
MTKAERLQEMIWLYMQRGYSDIEMAERLGVERTTVYRYRIELEREHVFVQDNQGRFRLDRMQYMPNIKVNLHEALALYLAVRRASRQTRIFQPHTANALEKLALALKKPMTESLVKAASAIMAQSTRPERVEVLEIVTQAWAENRRVRITHTGLQARQSRDYLVCPYLIEPSLWSDGAYLIGHSDVHKSIATFKIERIEHAELTIQNFTIPEDFDEAELLRYAWGIWYGEDEPVTVRLRFAAGRATRRLKESIWHPSQKLEDVEDGGCIWEAQVAEWQEMVPWIRGWGADCEVLEPQDLREEIVEETTRLSALYVLNEYSIKTPSERLLWAKASVSVGKVHRLLYHMIDVGETVQVMWQLSLPAQTRRQFSSWLGLEEEASGRLLAFWASLHDLGKAAPGFQRKYPPIMAKLKNAGFDFPIPPAQPARHGVISTWALNTLLVEKCRMTPDEAKSVGSALGGHHGTWPTSIELGPTMLRRADQGGEAWDEARRNLVEVLLQVFQPPGNFHLPVEMEALNTFLTLFSGLTSAADWIGSMDSFFPYSEIIQPPERYARKAIHQAETALRKLGWVGWQPDGMMQSFAEMFPATPKPYPIQQVVIGVAQKTGAGPMLAILESPTGSGKTEAALFLADHWLQNWQGRGLYIAMPTQATSNQMYERVSSFLLRRYPSQAINLHLVHGAALLAELEDTPTHIIEEDGSEMQGSVRAATWFLPRKRTLLAPFGVGTVDQTLMSVLQTRHFFVRLFGLGQKVVIFDEVHAYDTYMSKLFQKLLGWLRAIGTSVILLSATLPEVTRTELVAAWQGTQATSLPQEGYPRLTMVSQEKILVRALPVTDERGISLEWLAGEPQAIVDYLARTLTEGGCAAVICNRVRRAQEIYREIQATGLVEPENLILFHARFPFAWREGIEKKVLTRFGKDGQRPRKAIVVATQVIEQSLDLDFDVMISDLAPVDLVLQRAGRLQRHPKNDPVRPVGLRIPRFAMVSPQEADGLPSFGDDERVYDRAILLRTWLALWKCTTIRLPEETSALIETVYGSELNLDDCSPELAQMAREADEKARQERDLEIYQAKERMIPRPGYEDLLSISNQGLEEDNPAIHRAFRALTRLSDPGINLVCLHQTSQGLSLEPGGTGGLIDLTEKPSPEMVKELLRRSVSVQRHDVVVHFLNQNVPAKWKEVAALRCHYQAVFDEQGRCPLASASLVLALSQETGLEVIKEVL